MDRIKNMQAARKKTLAVTPNISRFLIPDTIEKTAQTINKIQPHNSKLKLFFFPTCDIVVHASKVKSQKMKCQNTYQPSSSQDLRRNSSAFQLHKIQRQPSRTSHLWPVHKMLRQHGCAGQGMALRLRIAEIKTALNRLPQVERILPASGFQRA